MTRRRLALTALWLGLALATLVVLVEADSATHLSIAALAWLGGIVSHALYFDIKDRRRA